MNTKKKYPPEDLKNILEHKKQQGKTIALANGCFDLIHIGHVRFLKAAKACADYLVVAVNSDHSIKQLKGNHRAILPEADRIKILESFECVDYLVVFEEPTVDDLLLQLKPHFHCKGTDYQTPEGVPEYHTVASYGGMTLLVGGEKIRSTSEIIEKIKAL